MRMKVERRTTFYKVHVLDDKKAAVCFARSNLEQNPAESERVRFAKAVLTRSHHVKRFSRGRLRSCGGRESLQSSHGKSRGCCFEEGTAFHHCSNREKNTDRLKDIGQPGIDHAGGRNELNLADESRNRNSGFKRDDAHQPPP
jgi:hypothetical protein